MTDFLAVYRKEGLGEVVRALWPQEKPQGSSAQVWAAVNRADMAMALAAVLVLDLRLLITAAARALETVTRFRGGRCHELMGVLSSAVFGGYAQSREQSDLLRSICVDFAGEYRGHLAAVLRLKESDIPLNGPVDVPVMWEPMAMTAANHMIVVFSMMIHDAPETLVRAQIGTALKYGVIALTRKLQDVDKLPEPEAARCAHELMVTELKRALPLEVFGVTVALGAQSTGAPN